MRRKLIVLLLLVLTSEYIVFGKNENKTKTIKRFYRNIKNDKHKLNNERIKRSLDDDSRQYISPMEEKLMDSLQWYENNFDETGERLLNKETPFWGTRGRRDSASDESVADVPLTSNIRYNFIGKSKNVHKLPAYLLKQRHDEIEAPFWGNRGRRASDESGENKNDLFWANRGRRQDENPFWGTRGRRREKISFWGNRGRRENVFYRHGMEDNEPFWGNRGRRELLDPRLDINEKNKLGRHTFFNDESEPFWGNRGRRKIDLKASILKTINNVQKNIDKLARKENSNMKSLISESTRDLLQSASSITEKPNNELTFKPSEQNTVHDSRIFAEEPRYILIERSSRSSEEDDPFYITRGKKFNYLQLAKATRGRRGALEDIVKSVRNDPYYIARGKKDNISKSENSSSMQNKVLKAKDLICATVELLKANKVKRQVADNERDRRTTLKKLALQLQMDPYFVSRGKKGFESDMDFNSVEQFINQISLSCN